MCGITGYFSFELSVNQQIIKNITYSIAHRGPDAEGFFFTEKLGLGHRRLSIIDLAERANQPMHSKSGKHVIVYNGEVYNFKELAKKYNISQRTSSDTEIILEAFEKIGCDIFSELNGMFALAIFDKTEEKLFLARDRMGIKPLFYGISDNKIVFGSELKVVANSGLFSKKKLNHKAINLFLHLGYIPQPHTIYSEINKFPAGSFAEIHKNNIVITPFWNLNEKISNETIDNKEDIIDKLDFLITDSVKKRMISDVPFGTFLSGGIDSSLVTAIAQKVSNTSINTFSIGFKENKFNEAKYAEKVSSHLNTNHHEFVVSEDDGLQLIDKLFDIYDEPFADSSAIPTLLVSKLAKKHVSMTLSGDGGDELFHGYGAYSWANRLSKPLIRNFHKPISLGLKFGNNRQQRVSELINISGSKSHQSHIFSQEQYFFSEKELKQLTNPEYFQNLEIPFDNKFNRKLNPAELQAVFDLNFYLKDDLLVKVDRASMHYGLENRVPLLDHRIVELALNINKNLKINNGEKKFILKQLLYKYLPEEYFNRPKWGFSIPLSNWMKGSLKPEIQKYTSEKIIRDAGIINYDYARNIMKQYYSGKDYLFNRVWLIYYLHRWLITIVG
ncbi:MAG: asparagine synthase (glutamine-hydrolyzing) [Bacteroidales bacterium]|nr:asparagine synthase (glutamine-hydrolyzing) [Bacteroidales bacterium]